jgi:hypothetical protein
MRPALWRSSIQRGYSCLRALAASSAATPSVLRVGCAAAIGTHSTPSPSSWTPQCNVNMLPRLDLVRQPTSQPCKSFVPDLRLLFI